jgi:hypothetical protein
MAIGGLVAAFAAACGPKPTSGGANGTTGTDHASFPISAGATHELGKMLPDGTVQCESCHAPSAPSFKEFDCLGCHTHAQPVTDRLHVSLPDYSYTSAACYKCHPASDKNAFDHKGITDGCALCHDMGATFAALPVAGFTHPPTGGADCGACHGTTMWKGAQSGPANSHDPAHDIVVNALLPTYAGIKISSLAPRAETLHMTMNHSSTDIPAAALSACANCHPGAGGGAAIQLGALHASLTTLGLAQPKACGSCHTDAVPFGFVGPTATMPARMPASGEMKHDAVAWALAVPTATKLVAVDCGACHAVPSAGKASWTTDPSGAAPATYHAALGAAKLAQPASCIDCHANDLPAGLTATKTTTSASAASGVPAGTADQINHADANVTTHDCNLCHTQIGFSSAAGVAGKEWNQASFHTSLPATSKPLVLDEVTGRCSSCHLNVKPPTGSTAEDHGAFTSAPGTQDCGSCHPFPGTGTRDAPNWLGATHVPHLITVGGFAVPQPPATAANTQAGIPNLPHPSIGNGGACLNCHGQATGSKPASGYDHASPLIATNCNSCHEAGSDLVAVPWNGSTTAAGGAGDTRPFTIVGLVPSFNGNKRALANDFNHFYPADCKECHALPPGDGPVTTGAAYKAAWKFVHNEKMMARATCGMCHGAPNNLPN